MLPMLLTENFPILEEGRRDSPNFSKTRIS